MSDKPTSTEISNVLGRVLGWFAWMIFEAAFFLAILIVMAMGVLYAMSESDPRPRHQNRQRPPVFASLPIPDVRPSMAAVGKGPIRIEAGLVEHVTQPTVGGD